MKNSLILYYEYKKHFSRLTFEQKGHLIDCIFDYEIEGKITEVDPIVDMAFSFIKEDLDMNNQKYQNIVERNRENGAKGGRPQKPSGFTEEPKEPSGLSGFSGLTQNIPEKPKKAVSVSGSVSDNESVIQNTSCLPVEKILTPDDIFEELWQTFPRKEGKKDALRIFKRDIKTPGKFEQLQQAIKNYSDYVEKSGYEARYIKQGSTFMGCWEEWVEVDVDSMIAKKSPQDKRQEENRDVLRRVLTKLNNEQQV